MCSMLRRGPVVTTIVVVPWAATERIDIERAVKLAGPELPADADFEIQGQDPMLPSPHYLGTGAAVARPAPASPPASYGNCGPAR